MCAHYTYNRNEAKFRLREKIVAFGAVPRASIRLTDLGPVIAADSGRTRRRADKQPLLNHLS
jgi:hypothetical protein